MLSFLGFLAHLEELPLHSRVTELHGPGPLPAELQHGAKGGFLWAGDSAGAQQVTGPHVTPGDGVVGQLLLHGPVPAEEAGLNIPFEKDFYNSSFSLQFLLLVDVRTANYQMN